MSYADARTALHEATVAHAEVLAAYNEVRDAIADDLRGTKAALSEADKSKLRYLMATEHAELWIDLEEAEHVKNAAQTAFDIADDAAKNARREMDAATADRWLEISERELEIARINKDMADVQLLTVNLWQVVHGTAQENRQ